MRRNSEQRHSPTDLDAAPVTVRSLEFDIRRCNDYGKTPWPERLGPSRFGPALIRAALKAGLYVVADIEESARPVVVSDARWESGCLEVLTLEGYRLPTRLRTLSSLKGYKL